MVYVPYPAIKSIQTQQDIDCNRRGNWIAKVQEYDLELKPTKLVRGKGLCKLMEENLKEEEENKDLPLVLTVSLQDEWFSDIGYFLTYGQCSNHLSSK